jgi:hypothetical protein
MRDYKNRGLFRVHHYDTADPSVPLYFDVYARSSVAAVITVVHVAYQFIPGQPAVVPGTDPISPGGGTPITPIVPGGPGVVPVCGQDYPFLCLTQQECEAEGLVWANGECNLTAVCSYEYPELCLTQEDCESKNGVL